MLNHSLHCFDFSLSSSLYALLECLDHEPVECPIWLSVLICQRVHQLNISELLGSFIQDLVIIPLLKPDMDSNCNYFHNKLHSLFTNSFHHYNSSPSASTVYAQACREVDASKEIASSTWKLIQTNGNSRRRNIIGEWNYSWCIFFCFWHNINNTCTFLENPPYVTFNIFLIPAADSLPFPVVA